MKILTAKDDERREGRKHKRVLDGKVDALDRWIAQGPNCCCSILEDCQKTHLLFKKVAWSRMSKSVNKIEEGACVIKEGDGIDRGVVICTGVEGDETCQVSFLPKELDDTRWWQLCQCHFKCGSGKGERGFDLEVEVEMMMAYFVEALLFDVVWREAGWQMRCSWSRVSNSLWQQCEMMLEEVEVVRTTWVEEGDARERVWDGRDCEEFTK